MASVLILPIVTLLNQTKVVRKKTIKEGDDNDEMMKKILIVKQILPMSTTGNVCWQYGEHVCWNNDTDVKGTLAPAMVYN